MPSGLPWWNWKLASSPPSPVIVDSDWACRSLSMPCLVGRRQPALPEREGGSGGEFVNGQPVRINALARPSLGSRRADVAGRLDVHPALKNLILDRTSIGRLQWFALAVLGIDPAVAVSVADHHEA